MNLILDTLKTRRSFRYLGHGLGLLAGIGFLRVLGFVWSELFTLTGLMLVPLALMEAFDGFQDPRWRRLAALAPTAFPFKNLSEDERAFVQKSLLTLPARTAFEMAGLWAVALAGTAGFHRETLDYTLWPALCFLGLPIAALTCWLGLTAMGRRIAPFYYFDGDTPDGLSDFTPAMHERLFRHLYWPVLVAVMLPVAQGWLGQPTLPVSAWLWLLSWVLALLIAERAVLEYLLVAPVEDLGLALGRLKEGDYDCLLDVTSGDELGVTTNRFNKAVRATDKRFFVRENFGEALPKDAHEKLFEGGLKLDGDRREVAVLALRLSGEAMTLQAFNRFCTLVTEVVDKKGGSLQELSPGLIVALFNAPLRIDEALKVAGEAGWDLNGRLKVFCAQQKMQSALSLNFGIGLAGGEAVLGLAGAPGRQRYLALGAVPELARQLVAKDGFWVDAVMREALGPPYAVSAEGEVQAGPEPKAESSANLLGFEPGARI